MIITAYQADRDDGGTDFIGPCGKACQSINREGTIVKDCPYCQVRLGWAECEIHCKENARGR